MADPTPPEPLPPRKQRSTESYGMGQSGYTAGRFGADPELEQNLEARNRCYPRGVDEHALDPEGDERWIGRGGVPWSPPDAPR